MPVGAGAYTSQIDAIHKDLIALVEKKAITLAINVTSKLRAATPIKTGWARSNWLLSIGTSFDTPVGSPQNVDYGPSNSGLQKIATYKLERGQIFITNNVPYILLLDNGSSPQAAAGFVRRAIEDAITSTP